MCIKVSSVSETVREVDGARNSLLFVIGPCEVLQREERNELTKRQILIYE